VLIILMHYADNPETALIRAVNDTRDNDTWRHRRGSSWSAAREARSAGALDQESARAHRGGRRRAALQAAGANTRAPEQHSSENIPAKCGVSRFSGVKGRTNQTFMQIRTRKTKYS
jgi:hypothetical protein